MLPEHMNAARVVDTYVSHMPLEIRGRIPSNVVDQATHAHHTSALNIAVIPLRDVVKQIITQHGSELKAVDKRARDNARGRLQDTRGGSDIARDRQASDDEQDSEWGRPRGEIHNFQQPPRKMIGSDMNCNPGGCGGHHDLSSCYSSATQNNMPMELKTAYSSIRLLIEGCRMGMKAAHQFNSPRSEIFAGVADANGVMVTQSIAEAFGRRVDTYMEKKGITDIACTNPDCAFKTASDPTKIRLNSLRYGNREACQFNDAIKEMLAECSGREGRDPNQVFAFLMDIGNDQPKILEQGLRTYVIAMTETNMMSESLSTLRIDSALP